ncbi:FAD-dependent monooxygenase [Pararhodobacter zhoushanensis]|uniref:FAD-dependent monooxygenase n=1 Tax=Pararhodobacter zhoushanensis TaxID=2479545 RepID=A0ABT3GU53_9RHOB|nr:FAD-dependent monooxygenase [Pararhodobacter zhoushanensis]MCW1931057.1 FAD-dependent monooxygenase [Pararhodobacter zhoushanensis]
MPKAITDVAIIGGGPVGLTAANLLGHLGIDCTLFERNETTSFHPRGHVVNTRTMEILRSVGLEEAVNAAALPPERHAGIGFVTSLAGHLIGVIETRVDPEWSRIEQSQSPALKRSCPQDRFEPVLREHANRYNSASVNFGYAITQMSPDDEGVDLHWQTADGATGKTRARYVLAADGPRSDARHAVGIGMQGRSIGQQIGIYFHADLWELVKDRPYLLNWIYNATTSGVLISLDGRYRWTYNFGYREDQSREDFTEERCLELLRAVIGTPEIDIEIKNIMPWRMQARIADQMSSGRVFLAGDAAHPLPPTGGQGMNTGIADVQNLAWKLKLVLSGNAPESLLGSYSTERRPVADFNVEQSARNAQAMARKGLSGMLANDSDLLANIEGPAGAENRAKLAEGIPEQRAHFDYAGQTFGYFYDSDLITTDGTPAPEIEVVTYTPTGRPGHRAPHLPIRYQGRDLSLLDLFTLDSFTVLLGPDADAWRGAADGLGDDALPRVRVFSVGSGQEIDTDTAAWCALYGVSPKGAVLVRPDGHVAWRSVGQGAEADLKAAFSRASGQIAALTTDTKARTHAVS